MIQLTEDQWMFFVSFAVVMLVASYFGGYASEYCASKPDADLDSWANVITAVMLFAGLVALVVWVVAAFMLAVS